MELTVFSDGGTNGEGLGAGGTIVEVKSKSEMTSYNLVSFLGKATNNEGEIFSSLLGFYLCRLITPNLSHINWVSDSQYAIKSGTQYIKNWINNGWRTANKEPVKNQGLWRIFLSLTEDISLSATHVKGHSGHRQNEACDTAVNWIRDNRAIIGVESYIKIPRTGHWMVYDAREALETIRSLDYSPNINEVSEIFSEVENLFKAPKSAPKETSSIKTSSEDNETEALECLKELTKGYIEAVRDIKDINKHLKTEKELKASLMFLKKWAN